MDCILAVLSSTLLFLAAFTLLFFPMLFSARLLLIAAIAFAEFYIPFVELSKIALSFVVFNVVFRSLV